MSKICRFVFVLVLMVVLSPALASDGIHTDRRDPIGLKMPSQQDSFTFAVFGDRTSGQASGLNILADAVDAVNVLDPDMVMTVGDLVSGYNMSPMWLKQAEQVKAILDKLEMPWFPTAGNHDLYWRGAGRPRTEHEKDYEQNFGPLWYAFEHKNFWFIVLCSDEGDPETGEKDYRRHECQIMSRRQLMFLSSTLRKAKDAEHVFVFLHHPRWAKDFSNCRYGESWEPVHRLLKRAGNVSACFAGHIHRMEYFGQRDGIDYYTMGSTGGSLLHDDGTRLMRGILQHFALVSVRGDKYSVGSIKVDSVIDPRSDKYQTLLEYQLWHVKSEETRTLLYPIEIPQFDTGGAILRIGISGGADDSGDRGVEYELRSIDGTIVYKGLSKGNKFQWPEFKVKSGEEYVLAIIDNDTSFEGKSPGNGGHVVVELDRTRE